MFDILEGRGPKLWAGMVEEARKSGPKCCSCRRGTVMNNWPKYYYDRNRKTLSAAQMNIIY